MAPSPANGGDGEKKLGTLDATLLVMGGIIGVGIFFTPQLAAQLAGSTPLILGVWVFGGLVALCAAFTFAELGATFPEAGGWFVYLREAFGRLPAFLFAWIVLSVVSTGATAAVSKFGVEKLHVALPALGGPSDSTAQQVFAALVVVAITAVALSGVKSAVRLQNLCMLTKLLVLAALMLCALVVVTPGAAATDALSSEATGVTVVPSFKGALSALKPVFFAYGGWQMVAYVAPQVKKPERTLPRAIVMGVFGVICVYVLANFAFVRALGPAGLANDVGFATRIAREASGATGERLIAAGMAVSALGWCIVLIITTPWLYVAMAREGLFFEAFGKLHPARGVPSLALVLQLGVTIGYIFAARLGFLVDAVVFVEWIFHGLVAFALIRLRRRRSDLARPYRSPLYPLAPAVYLIAAILVVGSTLVNDANEVRLTGLAVVGVGGLAYLGWRKRERDLV